VSAIFRPLSRLGHDGRACAVVWCGVLCCAVLCWLQVSQPLVPLVDEFASRLFQELDYVQEGKNAERFQVGGGVTSLG